MIWAAPTNGVGRVFTARWTYLLALLALGSAGLGGCSQLAELPDVTKLPQKVLSKDEQQGKVNEMIEKSQKHQAEAAKEIEKGK
jgi:hypothetical protein